LDPDWSPASNAGSGSGSGSNEYGSETLIIPIIYVKHVHCAYTGNKLSMCKVEEETEERTKELDDSWKQMLANLRGSGLVKRRGDVDQVRIQVQGIGIRVPMPL
jgi:hypothetical protein